MQRLYVVISMLVLLVSGCARQEQARKIALIGDTFSSSYKTPPGLAGAIARSVGAPVQDLTTLRRPPDFTVQRALQVELPALEPDATDAVVSLGAYDIETMAMGFQPLVKVEDANIMLVDALLSRNIRVFEFTVRDYTRDRRWKRGPIPKYRVIKFPVLVRQFNNFILSTPGIVAIDIRRFPELADQRNYANDGLHLTARGQAAYAQVLASVMSGKTRANNTQKN